jgi:hypothetical protein
MTTIAGLSGIDATKVDDTAAAEYLRRRADREAVLRDHARRDLAISHARTSVALAAALTAWLAFGVHLLSAWWLLLPALVFVSLMAIHERVLRRKQRAERAVAFYDAGLRRLEHRWIGRGIVRTDLAPPGHPYAADLDLFGRGSLFDMLCQARTEMGQSCLAEWLLHGAPVETIAQRHAAVTDLRDRLDFREELALLGEECGVDSGALAVWGEGPPNLASGWVRPAAIALAAAGIVTLLAWWPLGYSYLPFFVVLFVGQALLRALKRPLARVSHGLEQSATALGALSGLLERLEREAFDSDLLRSLRAELGTADAPASGEIGRLRGLIEWRRMQESILFMPVAQVLLWPVHFAVAFEGWRRRNGARIGAWVRVVGEFEALASLAAYAYEHPDDPFPDVVEGGPCFDAEGLGHPLLPPDGMVRSSLALNEDVRLLVVSGSNMSGKSTLLRTVGINAVLALAGAPVRAQRLRISPLQIGASLRTQDSLQGGVSRFYAEILRLRQIVELADQQPALLFLLDEILHGTNSHDRLIGAEAIARTLVARRAIGLITTHDLALARIESKPALHAVNVHFEDRIIAGKVSFDYLLRPGVVTKSNALELMRAVGLDV